MERKLCTKSSSLFNRPFSSKCILPPQGWGRYNLLLSIVIVLYTCRLVVNLTAKVPYIWIYVVLEGTLGYHMVGIHVVDFAWWLKPHSPSPPPGGVLRKGSLHSLRKGSTPTRVLPISVSGQFYGVTSALIGYPLVAKWNSSPGWISPLGWILSYMRTKN